MKQKLLALLDWGAVCFGAVASPLMRPVGRYHASLPRFQKLSDSLGFQLRSTHYYEPTYSEQDLPANTAVERPLPGLDLNEAGQLELLAACLFAEELREIPLIKPAEDRFGYRNGSFEQGDSEMLYNFIRVKKPQRIIEIGSGQSTLMARLAIAANQRDDAGYRCEHICVEPYEAAWLEQTGVTVVRERVEVLEPDFFGKLAENDILFIDSSHVIRPWGDVLYEFQRIVPCVAPGVIVHVHDIFTPRDYPEAWLRGQRRLWNEQYLLESFLTFNGSFQILCANNWLKHNHVDAFSAACPMMVEAESAEPGSFWFQRRSDVQA